MSADLLWLLVKDNNSFLVKRGRTPRSGAVQFSRESGNLLGVNSFKYSGLTASKTIAIEATKAGVTLSTKGSELGNKPKSCSTTTPLKLNIKSALKTIKSTACTPSYRSDLTSAATARFGRLYRDVRVKRGVVKAAKKSTRRSRK